MKRNKVSIKDYYEINKKLRICAIVGWSLNFLIVLVLILCSIFGRKANGVSAEAIYNDNYKTYSRMGQSSSLHITTTLRDSWSSWCELDDNASDYQNQTKTKYYNVFPTMTFYDEDNSYIEYQSYKGDYLGFTYLSQKITGSSIYKWYLTQIKIYDADYHAIGNSILTKPNGDMTALDFYVQYDYILQILEPSIKCDNTLSSFQDSNNSYNFTFNGQINYNSPLGLTLDSPYGYGGAWTSSTSDTAYIDYAVGDFISNGQLFDTIRVYYFNAEPMYFELADKNGNVSINHGASGSWAYMFMYFINTNSDTQILVNKRDQIAFMPTSSSNAFYEPNSSSWLVSDYRNCLFLELSADNKVKVNGFNNNIDNYYGNNNGGNNVFTLIGGAFTSWLPILNLAILPNITLGMLVFIPIVAMLVFAIIRIIKK